MSILIITLTAFVVICLIGIINRLKSNLEFLNEEMFDLKKHLNLPAVIRTKTRRHTEIIALIDKAVESGHVRVDIENGIKNIERSGGLGDSAVLGQIKIKRYREYIFWRIDRDRQEKGLKMKPLSGRRNIDLKHQNMDW